MRLVLLALLIASGCSDPARTARREVDRVTRLVLVTDARLQRHTTQALKVAAVEEGAATGLILRALGCPALAESERPGAPEKCQGAARAGRSKYEERAAKITAVAKKADQGLEAAWAALRLTVDVLEDLDLGALDKPTALQRLARFLVDLPRLLRDAQTAYEAVRLLAQGGAP